MLLGCQFKGEDEVDFKLCFVNCAIKRKIRKVKNSDNHINEAKFAGGKLNEIHFIQISKWSSMLTPLTGRKYGIEFLNED